MPPRKRVLRPVAEGETAPVPAKPLTVAEAARSGSTRDLLVAMRDRIARAVDSPATPAPALAALTKRLAETVREIEAIDARAAKGPGASAVVEDGVFDASAI